ncbi:MAG: hypothetical protein C0600_11260 [Ignavibacteria bacterium]|nr:MAG: hypothetical protein C0600_11260 [Ignavibacteria bacterium]
MIAGKVNTDSILSQFSCICHVQSPVPHSCIPLPVIACELQRKIHRNVLPQLRILRRITV